jgi:hypothetical protein
MPSMRHLSSSKTDLAQSNVCYADFDDTDYSHDNDEELEAGLLVSDIV